MFPSMSRLVSSSEVVRENVQGSHCEKLKSGAPTLDMNLNTINDIYFMKPGVDDGDISRRIGKVERINSGPTKT